MMSCSPIGGCHRWSIFCRPHATAHRNKPGGLRSRVIKLSHQSSAYRIEEQRCSLPSEGSLCRVGPGEDFLEQSLQILMHQADLRFQHVEHLRPSAEIFDVIPSPGRE